MPALPLVEQYADLLALASHDTGYRRIQPLRQYALGIPTKNGQCITPG